MFRTGEITLVNGILGFRDLNVVWDVGPKKESTCKINLFGTGTYTLIETPLNRYWTGGVLNGPQTPFKGLGGVKQVFRGVCTGYPNECLRVYFCCSGVVK